MQFTKVLVTGGAGFLGSQLLHRLLPISDKIYVIDDLFTGNQHAIPVSEKIFFYKESITNVKLLDEILPEVEWVFHLACRNLLLSTVDMKEDFNTNLYGGFLLLQKARLHCQNLKRFIYTSTASVYGNAPIIPTPESFYNITMPYSASKFATEHYCQVHYHMYGFPVSVLRLSNVYGPGQSSRNPYCGVITLFFEAILNGIPLTIYGDGTQTRDFTFIEDAIDALLWAATFPDAIGKTYNVGTGTETTINELADTVIKTTGHDSYPSAFQSKRIVDKVYRRAVDCRALNSDANWKPQHTLEDGLARTYEWIKQTEIRNRQPGTDL